jgi:hypothetical protein
VNSIDTIPTVLAFSALSNSRLPSSFLIIKWAENYHAELSASRGGGNSVAATAVTALFRGKNRWGGWILSFPKPWMHRSEWTSAFPGNYPSVTLRVSPRRKWSILPSVLFC